MTAVAHWIGHRWRRCGIITDRQVALFRTALGEGRTEAEVPPGCHWTMILDTAPADQFGADEPPGLGLYIPDLGLPRRMWAGGSLRFHLSLRRGDMLIRESVITDTTFKNGATGRLGFVTVEYLWTVGGGLRNKEHQDVVYRSSAKLGTTPA